MRFLPTFICACLIATASVGQERRSGWVDDNFVGPDIPIMSRDPNGGVIHENASMSRRVFDQQVSDAVRRKYGYPIALVRHEGKLYAVTTGHQDGLGQLDRRLGGDGYVAPPTGEIEIFNPDGYVDDTREQPLPPATDDTRDLDLANGRPNVIDLDTVAAEGGPIDLFSDAEIGAINPLDGVWDGVLEDVSITGCPPQVSQLVGRQFATASRSVTWTKPWWQPGDLSSEMNRFGWRPVGANGYFATPYDLGDQSAGSGMDMSVSMAMTVTSPDTILVRSDINLTLAPALAAIAGGSEHCQAIVRGKYVRRP